MRTSSLPEAIGIFSWQFRVGCCILWFYSMPCRMHMIIIITACHKLCAQNQMRPYNTVRCGEQFFICRNQRPRLWLQRLCVCWKWAAHHLLLLLSCNLFIFCVVVVFPSLHSSFCCAASSLLFSFDLRFPFYLISLALPLSPCVRALSVHSWESNTYFWHYQTHTRKHWNWWCPISIELVYKVCVRVYVRAKAIEWSNVFVCYNVVRRLFFIHFMILFCCCCCCFFTIAPQYLYLHAVTMRMNDSLLLKHTHSIEIVQ